jgi:hypothetical protein
MASAQIPLPAGTWVQITTTDKTGSVRHHAGNTQVVYVESPTEPAAISATTPTMETTVKGQDWAYFSVASSDFVWANANNADAVIVVSPGGS